MGGSTQVLAVGGNSKLLESIHARLSARGSGVEVALSIAESVRSFSAHGADLILACLPLADGSGCDLLRELRRIDSRACVIVTGCDQQIRNANDAFQLGAFEYVASADSSLDDLLRAVGAALGTRSGDMQLRWYKEKEASGSNWESIAGNSAEMRDVIEVVQRVCERTTHGAPPTILILGETGTGKGLLAKCIHYNGVRRNRAFVEINCAAIPATLLEAELFGHERGAFTDAKTSRPGLFETAHQGTLFLDEVASVPIDLQAKLLTAIDEKRVRRIGGRQSFQLDVQIVAASHGDLRERVRAGAFRADLYHRLNVVSITLPPLRRRGNDKLVLARMFIEKMAREYGIAVPRLSADAERYILEYPWPGNVRELKNQIERILLLATDDTIVPDHFEHATVPPPAARGNFSIQIPDDGVSLEEVERELIRRALERFSGNVSRSARYLKVSRQTLMYRIKKHGLA